MIKLFRNFRQNLLNEGKTSKYFKYAIGEIVLVVLGILIALQINNWNQNRMNKQNEKLILKELHKEFISNKTQLDTVIFINKRSFQSVKYVKSKLPIDIEKVNLDSLAFHLYFMGYTNTFNPSNGVTKALMNSSTFNLISNDELRQLLICWDDVVIDYQEEEIYAYNNYVNHLKAFEKKHFYWDDYKHWLTDPRIDLTILESIEFDNYVLDRYYDLKGIFENTSEELENVTNTIDKIIELSNPKPND
ncbi:DUF6090 family protein [Gaetbulibacter aquiaggeris]|uniref:DUF6090 family protein n=1 Tax=Gaetbulibacter aquiaggeris TaxID=1735373 RepID=A0ABW7MN78_9FLAO